MQGLCILTTFPGAHCVHTYQLGWRVGELVEGGEKLLGGLFFSEGPHGDVEGEGFSAGLSLIPDESVAIMPN